MIASLRGGILGASWRLLGGLGGFFDTSWMQIEGCPWQNHVCFNKIKGCPKQNQYFWMLKKELDANVGVVIESGDNLNKKY